MSDIPDEILSEAFDLVEAMASNKSDMLSSSDKRHAEAITDDANAIARALLAQRNPRAVADALFTTRALDFDTAVQRARKDLKERS